ncbi:spore coat protein [Shouchella patagoniensis]|uniref:spore coat protein n=1 Tax=Shouchella patagoniensis TaxID=228576 RepID=UPI0009957746|nr:spore coat protein [Shouchella patagoniensis]
MFHKRPNHCCPPRRPKCNQTLPTQSCELPAVVHPTKHNVVQSTQEYIVPEIHPSHTTHVKNHVYKHVHHYPHSDSVQEHVKNEQYCEQPMQNNVAPSNWAPNNMAPTNMKPKNMGPSNLKQSNVSPYSGYKK